MKPDEPNTGPQPSTRVGIYLRVSTHLQPDQDQSLQARKDEATRYAQQLVGPDSRLGSVVYYADLGRSGIDADRPELNRLLADARAGQLDLVLTCSGNRISRTWHGQARVEKALAEHNVRLRFVHDRPQTAPAGSV